MAGTAPRLYHLQGSARAIGLAIGRRLGARLEQNIGHYLHHGPAHYAGLDWDRLRRDALAWLDGLPGRFQDELEGLAQGAGLPLQMIAEWCFADECLAGGCSAFLCTVDGQIWIGRNNDIWVPDLWGYVTIREVEGRIPTISFGMEGDPFTPTGINRQKLWLHYHYLPVWDAPSENRPSLTPYVWLTQALETCHTLDEVESLLRGVDRTGGMMLFAVEGQANRGAVFECGCSSHVRRDLVDGWIAGTNHYVATEASRPAHAYPPQSLHRYIRLVDLLTWWDPPGAKLEPAQDLASILADPGVEQRDDGYGTVYANVACPGMRALWYTFGGYPAASAGAWRPVDWPWS